MSSDWSQVDRIFASALDRPAADRERFVRDTCAGDAELEARVLALLQASGKKTDALFGDARADLETLASKLPDPLLATGDLVGSYRLLARIGEGGMGTVYLAERADGQFEQRVAVKVIQRTAAQGDLERRFLLERQILADLQHPNIARLFDGGLTDGGLPYFVMELVEGEPLTEYCERERLSRDRRLDLVREVCRAVHYAHGKGVIHRDLKPSNILVDGQGSVKLLDFGIAKLSDDPTRQTHTRPGAAVFTPAYAAPEQRVGQPATEATDVYQLGLVLHELVREDAPPGGRLGLPEHRTTGSRSEDLDFICRRALAVEPADRYRSARALSEDLARFRTGHPVEARPSSPGYRLARFLGRNRPVVLVAAGLAAVSLLAGYLAGSGNGGPVVPLVISVVLLLVLLAGLGLVVRRNRTRAASGGAIGTRATGRREAPLPAGPEAGPATRTPMTDSEDSGSRRVVAVLPFENVSGTPDAELFAAGLHDDLLTELSKISSLTVISRASVKRFRGSDRSSRSIAGELGAGTVIQGGVQQSGDRLRLNVQLIDARSDAQVWAERFDRALTAAGIFDLQSELAMAIAERLAARLSPEEELQLAGRPTDDLVAYQLYLQGRGLFEQRTGEGMRRAIGYFERAIERDPEYALAWTGLADSLTLLIDYGHDMPTGSLERAESAARKALALEPDLAEAHASLGNLSSLMRRGPAALSSHRRAVELRAGYAQANQWLGWVHLLLGSPQDAVTAAARATQLDPMSPEARSNLAQAYLGSGDPERALAEARRSRRTQTDFAYARWTEALALEQLGRREDAAASLQSLDGSDEGWAQPWPETLRALRMAAGDRGAGPTSTTDPASGHAFGEGLVLVARGDYDAALQAFERATPFGWSETLYFRYQLPALLPSFAEDPRYGTVRKALDRSWGLP